MRVRARVDSGRLVLGPGPGPQERDVPLVQEDPRTCGATCLLAARLLCERDGGAAARLGSLTGPAGGLRGALRAEQLRLQALMNRRARGPLGPLPWPRGLGSTPWAVAGLLDRAVPRGRGGRAAYAVTWVGDAGPRWAAAVVRLRGHLADGAPVLLVVGGPLPVPREGGGPVARALRRAAGRLPAVPRHYVLALPWTLLGRADPGEGRVHVYDPASGSVGPLDLMAARDPRRPGPRGLGYWPRVLALVEPS
ncbi:MULTISPECIES: hypothetical protein [unclassified Actinomyces]|uniref:hypothetical protein n=2 Tax=Actinomyces TaxID=1654 RepID=UPI002017A202|nr:MULTISPECIES: hypothetical protein [unclassified Actinomyces]